MILVALAVLYGIYEVIFAAPARKKAAKVQTEVSAVNTAVITTALLNNSVNSTNAFIIGKAESNWRKDPFLERSSYKEWAIRESSANASKTAKIIYSGYVDAGKKKMAIINGVEYSVGEKLEMEGYILKNITPSKVRIENRNTGSELEITIQEE